MNRTFLFLPILGSCAVLSAQAGSTGEVPPSAWIAPELGSPERDRAVPSIEASEVPAPAPTAVRTGPASAVTKPAAVPASLRDRLAARSVSRSSVAAAPARPAGIASTLPAAPPSPFATTPSRAVDPKHLPSVYLGCDRMALSMDDDRALLGRIRDALRGRLTVRIDEESPKPGEGPRVIRKAPAGSLAVYLAAACAGAVREVAGGVRGHMRDDAKKLRGVVFVNVGGLDLETLEHLPRAWDDNFSEETFAGILLPGRYLRSAGIHLVQARRGTGSEDDRVRRIAEELVRVAAIARGDHLTAPYEENLIARHAVPPSELAREAQEILRDPKRIPGAARWLFLASHYIAGRPVPAAAPAFPPVPGAARGGFAGSLDRSEYRELAGMLCASMSAAPRVPATAAVRGKSLSCADIVVLFARILKGHTDRRSLAFPASIGGGA